MRDSSTIYELAPGRLERAAPLLAAPFDQPAYAAVFEGRQPGRVFVDDAENPSAALLCRSYDYYVAGSVDTRLCSFIVDTPEEPGVFQHFYGLVPLEAAWEGVLTAALGLESIARQNFQWPEATSAPEWESQLTPEMRLTPIDGALAERLDREAYPVPFIRFAWGGYAAYEAGGFGFCLWVGEAVASSVFAVAVSSRYALVDINTEPPFRRRGLAALVGGRFVDECLRRGLLPVWDCDRENVPSAALAQKIGFVESTPFVELAMPGRAPLPLSRGRWSAAETREDGARVWRQV